ENERRKKEDEKRAKEDERRRKEDERRLAEDKEHREEKAKQRAKKFAEEFTQESEQGASSRRKVARHKQSYSPPKAKKGTLPTRAKSHLHQRGVGQQGLDQLEEVFSQSHSLASAARKSKDKDQQASLDEEARLKQRIEKLQAERLRKFDEEQARVAAERKSRPERRVASSQLTPSSSIPASKTEDRKGEPGSHRKDIWEKGEAGRTQSSDARMRRESPEQRPSSASSFPRFEGGPIGRYHQRVAQEQREWDYLNRPQQ
ncbi:MAG: hypothetical protein GY820_27985, partial [Gammaproteobacteria bacterium]|nr:hypothetical protein [Gammaproteobacteria bacterium]